MKQYTGRTLDEVLNSIASEQGCQVQDITYNVLEEEKGGIFGLHKSIIIEAFTSKDVKEFIFDYLGAYFTELNQGVAIEIIVEKDKEKEYVFSLDTKEEKRSYVDNLYKSKSRKQNYVKQSYMANYEIDENDFYAERLGFGKRRIIEHFLVAEFILL